MCLEWRVSNEEVCVCVCVCVSKGRAAQFRAQKTKGNEALNYIG